MLDTLVKYLRGFDPDLVIILLAGITVVAVLSLVANILQWMGKRKIKKLHMVLIQDLADSKGELSGLKKVNQVTIDTILKRLDGYMLIIQAALNIRTNGAEGGLRNKETEESYVGPRDEARDPDEDRGTD